MFCLRILVVLIFCVFISNEAAAIPWHLLSQWLTGSAKKLPKNAPRQADELPPLKGSPESTDGGLGLSGPLVTRSLAKAYHNKICPTMSLRVSLPQLNARISVPSNLNFRNGPGTNYPTKAQFKKAGEYTVDLLKTDACWMQIRLGNPKISGWVYSKHLKFVFDNHLTKPQQRLTNNLGADGVYNFVSRSTYKIKTPAGQGTAVATSPTILLTNCHVVGGYNEVQIMENGRGYKAVLIHDDYSKDKCFIRSLELEVRPVSNVKSFAKIRKGEQAFSIGAPLGYNRSFGKGIVFQGQQRSGDRWVLATTPVDHGSSGGGLFDIKGNLIGITTQKTTINNKFVYSSSIVAEDFWK